jgi:photosystem II stability/assembly factor-like uncharacterized protein
MGQFRSSIWWGTVVLLLVAGCQHGNPEDLPLYARKISIADKFYDVATFDKDRAIVVGYAGKILATEDGGQSWDVIPSGTKRALYDVEFVGDKLGWIVGQDGTILHSVDGGKTWARQNSGTKLYLFALDFVSELEGWAVGDRAVYLHTVDGGVTWTLGKIVSTAGLTPDQALLMQEPVLYDVQFLTKDNGWIVGEIGNIYHTSDGGRSWNPQQETLLGEGFFDILDLPTFFGVQFADENNGIVAGLEGRVARTSDGGKNWQWEKFAVEEPIVDPLFGVFQFADTTAWSVGASGEVVRQAPSGTPWKRTALGMGVPTWLRTVHFLDKDNGWIVGGFGTILQTTDGGETWLPAVG